MDVFEQALLLDAHERREFLTDTCGDDESLRIAVEALLAADEDADASRFLTRAFPAVGDRSGELIGAYRLVRIIGSGGMGTVYRAERADGAYAKAVAIKLILFDAGDLRTRFALEQRALGTLAHPNIAMLLDAGRDANGAPFFIMELVEGRPIDVHARAENLSVRARVRMFLKILDAVQTAHNQLIVHRDIKPNNILVDANDEPKLLDFGIAKLLGDATSKEMRTSLGPLTPEYSSPEQVRGEPIGTASDIYSLGVLLYELVTDHAPYRFDDRRPSTIERVVCEIDPPRPSTYLAKAIGGSAQDLDAIVAKALQKNAKHRYVSCAAFADDLARWLDLRAVSARVPSVAERAVKFVARHRVGVSIAAGAAIAVVIGVATALWQAREATLARDRAERINAFLQEMLGAAEQTGLGRDAKLADVLDTAHRSAEIMLADDPGTLIATEITLTNAYDTMGDLEAAKRSSDLALAVAQKAGLAPLALDVEIAMSNVLINEGQYDQADRLLARARQEAIDRGTPRQRGETAVEWGFLETKRDNLPKAESWLELALQELPSDLPALRAAALNDLAVAEESAGDFSASIATIQRCIDLLQAKYPKGHPLLAQALGNYATALDDVGQHDAASAMFKKSLDMKIAVMGEDHFSVIGTLSTLTWRGVEQKDVASALQYGARAWAGAQKLAPENPSVDYAAITYAQALMLAGRPNEALPLVRTALDKRRARLPADSAYVANTQSVLALAMAQAGDVEAAKPLAHSSYLKIQEKLGADNPLARVAHDRLEEVDALERAAAR